MCVSDRQGFDDRAIDFGRLTDHFQPDFLVGLGRHFTDETRHALNTEPTGWARIDDAILELARV